MAHLERSHRAIIAGLVSAKAVDTEARVQALTSELAAQGIEVVATLIQRRGVSRSPSGGGAKRLDMPMSAATVIGAGKAEELAMLARDRTAGVVVFLNDLSPSQVANLATITRCQVISQSALKRPR